jgi:Ca2+-binding RTX toxin-like protein
MVPEGPELVTGVEIIVGSNYNDQMTGGDGDDTFVGAYGDDTLIGGAGNDCLDGSGDNDTLTGGADADSFIFAGTWGEDTVTDFGDGADVLAFTGSGLGFSDLAIAAVNSGADTVISDGFGNSITLLSVTPDELDQMTDFIFA